MTLHKTDGTKKDDYRVTNSDGDYIRIVRNCGTHDRGKCIDSKCGLSKRGTYYVDVSRRGALTDQWVTLTDEEMQEFFMAYLATRKDVGYDE